MDKRDPRLDAPRILRDSVVKPPVENAPAPQDRRSGEERRGDVRRTDDVQAMATDATLMVELRGLASTVRQCQRNGHPDLSKHLDALLTKLGA